MSHCELIDLIAHLGNLMKYKIQVLWWLEKMWTVHWFRWDDENKKYQEKKYRKVLKHAELVPKHVGPVYTKF